jgi:hypothetical protein
VKDNRRQNSTGISQWAISRRRCWCLESVEFGKCNTFPPTSARNPSLRLDGVWEVLVFGSVLNSGRNRFKLVQHRQREINFQHQDYTEITPLTRSTPVLLEDYTRIILGLV